MSFRRVNALTRNKKTSYEILPLREHRRISLHCPNCEQYSLMAISRKTRRHGKVTFYVTCPKCGHSFKQVGRPYNFFRDIKSRYNLDSKQMRAMQKEVFRKFFESGGQALPLTSEDDRTIRAGDMTFIKPLSHSRGARRGSPTGKTTKKR
ncbi:hypothetical protein ES703_44182 [subsurface metagenome]